jgi:hypothetical protein
MARYEAGDEVVLGPPWGWHLCWQAAVGCDFVADRELVDRLRDRLIDAHRRRGRTLVFFSLLPTEMHVICRLDSGESPGDVARAVGSIAARWLRGAQVRPSPVFAGPFLAMRLQTEADELRTLLMLCWRPVFQGLCRTPSHHPDSSLRTTLGLSVARGFDARPALQQFGTSVISARAAMRRWLARRPSRVEAAQWELANGLVLVRAPAREGSQATRALRTSAAARLVAASRTGDIAGALRLLEQWVAARLGISDEAFAGKGRDRRAARGRALVACLAVDMELCPAIAIASHFGRAKATLSEQMAACRRRSADMRLLMSSHARVVEEAVGLLAAPRQGQKSSVRTPGASAPSKD